MVLLATVLVLAAVMAILVGAFAVTAGSRARITRKQLFMEQAFYVAEGGAEVAAAHIIDGRAVPATLTGQIGRGSYVTTIVLTNVVGSASKTYLIRSTGTVEGMPRIVVIEGARQKTWAKFAL
jgi:hypothetical protein